MFDTCTFSAVIRKKQIKQKGGNGKKKKQNLKDYHKKWPRPICLYVDWLIFFHQFHRLAMFWGWFCQKNVRNHHILVKILWYFNQSHWSLVEERSRRRYLQLITADPMLNKEFYIASGIIYFIVDWKVPKEN